MLKKTLALFVLIVSIFSFNSTFALELTGDIKLDKADSNSLNISWNAVAGATCYSIYYDTKASTNGEYANEELCVDDTKFTMKNLASSTSYYISIAVVRSDTKEGAKSKEVNFSTIAGASSDGTNLKINSSEVLNTREIKLVFNADIDKTAAREFKIVNKDDSLDEINVESSDLAEPNTLILKLASDLKANSKYDLTIISLTGKNGENIQVGVDGIVSLVVGSDISAPGEEESNIDLNAGSPEELTNTIGGENVGTGVVASMAVDDKLPKTGPAEIFLLLAAFLLAGIFMKYRNKKV